MTIDLARSTGIAYADTEDANVAEADGTHTVRMTAAYQAVLAHIESPAVAQFERYVFGGDAVMDDFGHLCRAMGTGAHTAAGLIVVTKGAVIAQLIILGVAMGRTSGVEALPP